MNIYSLGYPLIGIVAGFFAGLFGVGGGLIVVPLLFSLFFYQGFPFQHILHMALGTAMATILITSLSSMRAHHQHGAVDWGIVRHMSPGLLAGTLSGSVLATMLPTHRLAGAFAFIVYIAAIQLLLNFKPKPHRELPHSSVVAMVGGIVGVVSSLVAAGGGFLTIPFMLYCNVSIHRAVGTSSALGFPIALAGTIGYIISGYALPDLPSVSLGYVYLPAFLGIILMSVLTAPLGARLAHRLPVQKLKRGFGVLLALLATKMFLSWLQN